MRPYKAARLFALVRRRAGKVCSFQSMGPNRYCKWASGTISKTSAAVRAFRLSALATTSQVYEASSEAYSFIMVHNHPSGDPSPSEADMRLTRRILEASRILQIQLLDHVIIGAPAPGRSSYFSFKEGGVIS